MVAPKTDTPTRRARRTLPPGQRRVEGFPRFGTQLAAPPPEVPDDPAIEVRGAGVDTFAFPLSDLAALPRTEREADLHCVTGWTSTDLHWSGIAFTTFYRAVIEPVIPAGTEVSHIVFRGLDRYRSVVEVDDALSLGLLLADTLDGRPLDGDHGAPIRIVSPDQYGFASTKHLCRIDLHTSKPDLRRPLVMRILDPHPRARVWEEERHGRVPGRALRLPYRLFVRPIRTLAARGHRAG